MILNPFVDSVETIPGTRILADQRNLPGTIIIDPRNKERSWSIMWLFSPLPTRLLGGIRALLCDSKGFVTFCNQRDLEILLGMAKSGEYCKWAKDTYPEPGTVKWYGLCCDDVDLQDDLFARECQLREEHKGLGYLPTGIELIRRVHFDENSDGEEMLTLLGDCDMDTGMYPDTRVETVGRRWVRVEKTQLLWEQL